MCSLKHLNTKNDIPLRPSDKAEVYTCTYMCLGQDDHVDLRAALRESDAPTIALDAALDKALFAKPEKHDFEIKRRGSAPALPRHMSMTGG